MSRAALLAALALFACTPAPTQPAPPLEGFDWLTGCWLSRDGAVEQWAPSSSSAMAATSLFPQSDGTQISQTLRIESRRDGSITFAAAMSSGEPMTYTLVTRGEREAVFENTDNNGPKRVVYTRDGDRLVTTLFESIERNHAGYTTRYEACDNAPIAP